jgi:soluble lytic murein transglycosylase-like protein
MITVKTKLLLSTLLAVTCMTAQACRADCFDAAAKYQKVNPKILRGIGVVESHDNPHAIGHNKNGSVDYGIMQINSIHLRELKKYGVRRSDLMNECKNIYTAAWLLHQKMNKYGNSWKAVGAYHSETPSERDAYARKVRLEVYKLASN